MREEFLELWFCEGCIEELQAFMASNVPHKYIVSGLEAAAQHREMEGKNEEQQNHQDHLPDLIELIFIKEVFVLCFVAGSVGLQISFAGAYEMHF
ncbi:hypothetical protein POTOM_059921 [Populus tomentosa]|uniref:Uncharacterized protein n=1 Tax=Populus tomentosa TaxID=118781 RepID=A0A8X7XUL6_POPTO|nr:hypothetical protein POTOM_059921 [Populus tomentosa]